MKARKVRYGWSQAVLHKLQFPRNPSHGSPVSFSRPLKLYPRNTVESLDKTLNYEYRLIHRPYRRSIRNKCVYETRLKLWRVGIRNLPNGTEKYIIRYIEHRITTAGYRLHSIVFCSVREFMRNQGQFPLTVFKHRIHRHVSSCYAVVIICLLKV